MKINVKVQGKNFVVEIIDPLARPVVAYVEGERFEIWPEEENG
ncbi:MAG: acetyl-CoA carboxylase biotin carboxyl carrier protein subunit, partial [Chloroflexi bacterium]